MKTLKVLLLGFVAGFICASLVGYFSLYELFAVFLDKPLFQTHGMWILGIVFIFFMAVTMVRAYDQMYVRMESRYNIIESLKEWGKVLAEESAKMALREVMYELKYTKKKGD